jgi:DNA-binding response OmpR family regulator
MITAFPVLEPTPTAMEGADGFVTKPMRPSDLIGLATGLIERSRQLREQGEQRDRSLRRSDDLGRLAQHLGQGPLDLRRQLRIR